VTRQELSTGCRNRADANVVGLAGLEQLNHSRPSREMDMPTVDYVIHALIDQPTALLTAWPIAPPHSLACVARQAWACASSGDTTRRLDTGSPS